MPLAAFVFDVDGTLVDSNWLHAEAWSRSFAAHGFPIAASEVMPHIGKGGDKLAPDLAQGADEAMQKALRERTPREFKALAEAQRIRVFPGADAIFGKLRAAGMRTAIATSAKRNDFETVIRTSGIDPSKLADETVTGDDAEESKPDPDLVAAAIARLRLPPSSCVMVGDTPYDAEAARRAGARAFGVLTGIHDDATLRAAGASEVFRDVGHLLEELDRVLAAKG